MTAATWAAWSHIGDQTGPFKTFCCLLPDSYSQWVRLTKLSTTIRRLTADNMSTNEGIKPKKIPSVIGSSSVPYLKQLSDAVAGQAVNATFACGGSIDVSDLQDDDVGQLNELLCPPITIRWDNEDHHGRSKVTLPLISDDVHGRDEFARLLSRCQPATFGVGGKDILDETYRKAGKLDKVDFSTSFHPHDCGE